MKKLYILFVGLFLSFQGLSQTCLPNGITFTTQQQIDNFPKNYPGCKSIGGRLTISGSDITNLSGLSQLTSLGGVYIYKNNSLTSLYGLNNVTSVYSLHIGTIELNQGGNPLLTSLNGLNALTNISNELEIYDNNVLTSLTGLEKLTYIGGGLKIANNEMLSNIASLKKLTKIGYDGGFFYADGISIHNTALTSLEGLDNVTAMRGGINISQNPVLTSITGFENILIDSITDLRISDNPYLVTCDLENLCNYLKNPRGGVSIYNNADGCNSPTEMAYECGISVPCLPFGNYYFLSQSDINNFRINYPDCKDLGGNVRIKGNDIVSLSELNRVSSIDGDLEIDSCQLLVSLAGLDSLTTVGSSVYIGSNDALSGLTGLNNLQTVGWGFGIRHNPLLTNLSGLDKLTSTGGGLNIEDNKRLTSLNGLDNLSSTHWLQILDNPKLTSIASLNNLTSIVGDLVNLWIWNNYALESLDGLHNITAVEGTVSIESNTLLKNLNGLKKLSTVDGSLEIGYNPALTSLTGFENLTFVEFDLWLYNNDSLRNCNGLENLTSTGRDLWIFENPLLVSLEALKNIDAESINSLYISDNPTLSACEVKSICDYIATPNANVTIENNLEGCNTVDEVKAACESVGVWAVGNWQPAVGSFPNPFSELISIEYTLEKYASVNLAIFNLYGQEIKILVNEPQPGGTHLAQWNACDLPEGIYFYRLQAGNRVSAGKIIKNQKP
jgi:hypothetical protein